MRNTRLALGAGLLVLVCLCGVVALVALLAQVRGAAPNPLLSYWVQRDAQDQACSPPGSLVAGSYQADPAQAAGGWVVVTYTAECDPPGQPRQQVDGFVARSSQGPSCTGWGIDAPNLGAPGEPNGFSSISRGECGGPNGPGGPGGLDVITGRVVGTGVVSVEVTLAGGGTVRAPIRQGRFAVTALGDRPACAVRALDVNGAVLAEDKLVVGGSGAAQPCP
jgi:hypothetical protein